MKNIKILIVDDEAELVESLSDWFRGDGCEVYTASGGKEAMEYLSKPGQVDVVLTDVRMPRGSGIELAKAALNVDPSLLIYFMTGYSGMSSDEALEIGSKGVFVKPFNLVQMSERVHSDLQAK